MMQQPANQDGNNDAFLTHKAATSRSPLNQPATKKKKKEGRSCTLTAALMLEGGPVVIFILTALMTTAFWQVPAVIASVIFIGVVIAAVARVGKDPVLNVTGCMAVFTGVVCGAYAHEACFAPFFVITLGREYRNVQASWPAAAFADAGRLVFAKSSTVDTTRGVGYQDGHTYCAAPVIDSGNAQTRTIGFWAVGIDCCNARGDFECDAAGNSGTNGGVIVASDGLLERSRMLFLLAVNQSAAVNNLVVEEEPLLIRWVEDPAHEQLMLFLSALGVLTLGLVLLLLFVFTAATVAWLAAK
jgi:hypothetical protein